MPPTGSSADAEGCVDGWIRSGQGLDRTRCDARAASCAVGGVLPRSRAASCWGASSSSAVRIRETPVTRNAHPSPERAFRIAPQDILHVARAGRERGLTVLGFWHGHLSGPAHAGEADADGLAAAEALGPERARAGDHGARRRTRARRACVRARPDGPREIPLAT